MDTCFVIQPFDKDKFDKRYDDIFEPAIKAAGLEPYRVDRDPSVRIPIAEIEEGIRNSKICFAEITTDNPNVWYELGFAFALDKDIVMVTEERLKFPFDIQHKLIINYKTSSKSDYEKLELDITTKLKAFLQKSVNVQRIIENPVKESQGLKPHEVTMVLVVFENQISEEDTVSAHKLYRGMEAAGFNKLACNVALRELKTKGLLAQSTEYSEDGDGPFVVFNLTPLGENWVLQNQDKIEFRTSNEKMNSKLIDDLPF